MTSYNYDPSELAENWAKIAEESQALLSDFVSRQSDAFKNSNVDPLNISKAFSEYFTRMMSDPAKVLHSQLELMQDYIKLWQSTSHKLIGLNGYSPVIKPDDKDKRFKDASWDESIVFDYIKQSYLLTAKWMQEQATSVDGLDENTMKKVDFYTRQFVDAMAPSNFLMTNPEALKATIESKGENLVKGLKNLLEDLERGKGKLNIKMTDLNAFELGKNIAATPGKVVYQNDLMQLLQYTPTTEKVHKKPLMLIPAWINKYYIFDLQEKSSLVKWLVDQGFTVFMISWVNPDERHREKGFEDYMYEGPLAAIEAIENITGETEIGAVGYCLGGTLLATTLAWLKAKKHKRISHATFVTTMVDFSDVGEISVFIDEEQLGSLESRMSENGYLEGSEMATTFNMLRANDLIWSFVVNNYLLGKEPFPFDMLYWNSDSTRLPAKMHSFYLRNMYQNNLLIKPGALTVGGVKIDLRNVDIPVYLLSTREDHIAPWKTTYTATQVYSGNVKFVLAGSGHVAGAMNHPAKQKYSYWENTKNPENPDEWLKGAKETAGSWWPSWAEWNAKLCGEKVAARKPGSAKVKPLMDAPGSYVKVRV